MKKEKQKKAKKKVKKYDEEILCNFNTVLLLFRGKGPVISEINVEHVDLGDTAGDSV